ncbi:hypothetical protein [Streptomyces yaizuensis]|uniref:DUF1652 domain-containing protein n=1 Tax=Streptomyces yaizuensis TaxID=2989713 RepID=A0ABQ5NSC6_9ACTN|nr:hypothetical protein [Streptomyces sp. YSPA8]GLF93255.1 DUF1652 domain-containing protein [Streptomyces sp. YSPA8]
MADAPIEFDVSYTPDPPVVTVQATAITDTALTVQVTDVKLDQVTFTPKTPLADVLSGLVNDLAKKAPDLVREKTEGLTPDIPLNTPIGCSIPVGGATVQIRLAAPQLGDHDGMLMISGTADVS